jgi:hypothetical protein
MSVSRTRVTWYLSASITLAVLLSVLIGARSLFAGYTVSASLSGDQETHAVESTASGDFELQVRSSGLTYVLIYSGFESPNTPTAAHIHVGPPGADGPIVTFLCGGGSKPACPHEGYVFDSITSADVMDAAPDIAEGDLTALIDQMNAGNAYVNVHTPRYPDGELRGNLSQQLPQSSDGPGRALRRGTAER